MTKSTITRERLEKIKSWRETYGAGSNVMLPAEEAEELARIALAAMDSEPVAWTSETALSDVACEETSMIGQEGVVGSIPLYRHAQPALVQPVMFIDGDISSEDADKLAKVIREFNEEDERPLAKMARIIRENPHPTNECDMPKAQPAPECQHQWRHGGANKLQNQKQCIKCGRVELDAQRAPVLPDERAAFNTWNNDIDFPLAGRDAKSAAWMAWQVRAKLAGNSPVIPDGYVMVPKVPTPEMLAVINEAIKSMRGSAATYARVLAAAPQEVRDE